MMQLCSTTITAVMLVCTMNVIVCACVSSVGVIIHRGSLYLSMQLLTIVQILHQHLDNNVHHLSIMVSSSCVDGSRALRLSILQAVLECSQPVAAAAVVVLPFPTNYLGNKEINLAGEILNPRATVVRKQQS